MLTSIRSRRMPALLTRTSSRPKASTAALDHAPGGVEVRHVVAVGDGLAAHGPDGIHDLACRPNEPPVPSTSAPRSLTTTLAPWRANSRACSRPIPRPASGHDDDPALTDATHAMCSSVSGSADSVGYSARSGVRRPRLGRSAGPPWPADTWVGCHQDRQLPTRRPPPGATWVVPVVPPTRYRGLSHDARFRPTRPPPGADAGTGVDTAASAGPLGLTRRRPAPDPAAPGGPARHLHPTLRPDAPDRTAPGPRADLLSPASTRSRPRRSPIRRAAAHRGRSRFGQDPGADPSHRLAHRRSKASLPSRSWPSPSPTRRPRRCENGSRPWSVRWPGGCGCRPSTPPASASCDGTRPASATRAISPSTTRPTPSGSPAT